MNIVNLLKAQWLHLTTLNRSDRPWEMPFAAALASGLPLCVGAWFGRLDYGLVSSLGGLVFLYLPGTPLYHRMVTLMACAFAIISCYTIGLLSHFVPVLMMPALIFTTIITNMVCRFYALSMMPGVMFFIMTAAIGAYTPIQIEQLPLMVGLITLGALLASLAAFFYSLHRLRLQAPQPVTPLPKPTFDFVIFDPVVIGVFVGISLALAQLLELEKAYWVPVSCLAVIQGASLRAVWNKQMQRILGTGIGLLVAWGLFLMPLNTWGLTVLLMVLTFIVETAVVRHYGFAAIFVTPLTILLAEAGSWGQGVPAHLIEARFYDTVLGCAVGLAGGACLHSPRFRTVLGQQMRRLVPQRLR